jgi:hypothetical protein
MGTIRRRFWIESGLALACAALAVLTLAWRDWIEALTGLNPDRHSGSVEWLVVVALLLCSAVVGLAARAEWRHARPTPAHAG